MLALARAKRATLRRYFYRHQLCSANRVMSQENQQGGGREPHGVAVLFTKADKESVSDAEGMPDVRARRAVPDCYVQRSW